MSHLDEGTLHELLDGEIPSPELEPITAHLAECAECRARLETERRLLGEAGALVGLLELPALEAKPVPLRPRRRPWRELAWAASLVAAAGLGYAARGKPVSAPAEEQQVAVEPSVDSGAAVRLDSASPSAGPSVPAVSAPAEPAAKSATLRRDASPPAVVETKLANQAQERQLDLAERKQVAVAPTTSARAESSAVVQEAVRPTPPPAAGGAVAASPPARLTSDEIRARELRAGDAARGGFRSNTVALAAEDRLAAVAAETISLPDAVRRLGGSLRLIDGMIPLRLEAQGPSVRVIYPAGTGELVLRQQLIDGRVLFELLAPAGFPADSLARLKARVRE